MKLTSASRFTKLVALLVALPAIVSAHPGHDGGHDLTWDFSGGFTHPLFGFDHLLAMIAVGIWAAQVGGRARWMVPAIFVGVMTLGTYAGQRGVLPAHVEQVVAASLLALGLMIALAKRLPVAIGALLVALFGAYHGFAHGAELPAGEASVAYGIGLMLMTILLHTVGVSIGSLETNRFNNWLRAAGAGVATVGAIMLVAR